MHLNLATLYLSVVCALAAIVPAALSADKSPPINELTFRTEAGKSVAWKDLAGDKGTVVVFLSFDCPMSTSYTKSLSDLAKATAAKGIKFVGLCPCDEDASHVAKKAKEYEVGFPVFKDVQLAATDSLGATTTPQVFVLNAQNWVVYSGQIDDGYSKRLIRNKEVTQNYLNDAIGHVLAPKRAVPAKTEPIGCHIVRDAKRGTSTEVTYTKDVQAIIQNRCQGCHRPGEVGPFSLMTYKQAVNWADDIKDYTKSHKMPPWKATGGKQFDGDRRLSEKEIQTIAKWVDNGCPQGDVKDAPPEKKFPEGWQLGKPDLVLTSNDDFILGPTGKDLFRVFVMPTNLTEDKYVVAVEVRPGNAKVVHHTLNFFDTTGSARKLEEESREKLKANPPGPDAVDVGPGFSSSMGIGFRPSPAQLLSGKQPVGALGGWAPGIMPKFMPEGTGFLLPAGSDFVMQMHYHRNGKREKDRTQVGLYFAKKPVEKPMLGLVAPGRFKTDAKPSAGGVRFGGLGYIPAGDSHFVARGGTVALEDCTLYTVLPHMHLLGKSVKITMTTPDGKTEIIIDVADWDYNWQEQYILKEPIKVKSGTRFDIEAVFDNSASNPNNPSNPPIDVRFGEQTTNEMLFGFLGATKDHKNGIPFLIMQKPDFGGPRR
jgi:mono/diheme cytochrome c family protein